MKYFKNPWLLSAAGCFLLGLACLAGFFLHTPAKELTPPEFEQLLTSKELGQSTLSPTPYPGFYRVEGIRKSAGKPAKFYITTHLEDAQVKLLLEKQDAKIDMPGAG